ncbi:MAG TPA: hypothetical protein VK066_13270 [Chloroflexota bacterium]|nr:hypothetical protein [Chloroflexota bacterium]
MSYRQQRRQEAIRFLVGLARRPGRLSHTGDGEPYLRLLRGKGKRTRSYKLPSISVAKYLRQRYRDVYQEEVSRATLALAQEIIAGFALMAPNIGGRRRLLG